MNNTPDTIESDAKVNKDTCCGCKETAPADDPKCMKKRDGETNIAVGLFLFALGIPVLLGTLGIDGNVRAATVNAVCGFALLSIGGGWIVYGWRQFRQATRR